MGIKGISKNKIMATKHHGLLFKSDRIIKHIGRQFKPDMVNAIMRDMKFQTRRMDKLDEINEWATWPTCGQTGIK